MSKIPQGATVAVTGANGFIASHIVDQLLKRGYTVRAVVRNKGDVNKTEHLSKLAESKEATGKLEFFNGDLMKAGSYDDAFAGADVVIHTAAVVLLQHKDPVKAIVEPSVEGTKNVLASADKAGTVKRFVHTSSIAAILDFGADSPKTFDETDFNTWSNPKTNGDAYGFAKYTAEKLVADHTKDGACGYDSTFINPAVVLGPCLCKAHTKASAVVVRQCIYGNEQPNYYSIFVDVREVAAAHINAMERPESAGQRYILASGDECWISELGSKLQPMFPEYVITSPGIAWWKILIAKLTFQLNEYEKAGLWKEFSVKNDKSKKDLGIQYRKFEDTLRDTVTSMIDTGFVKPRK